MKNPLCYYSMAAAGGEAATVEEVEIEEDEIIKEITCAHCLEVDGYHSVRLVFSIIWRRRNLWSVVLACAFIIYTYSNLHSILENFSIE